MPRNVRLYFEDILTASNKILKYTGDSSCSDLVQDEMRLDAIVRNFEIIGEAAAKVPSEFRDTHPSMEWLPPKYFYS
jgi:uncharacterized protein with HEPN domain